MPTYKRVNPSGKVVWAYKFNGPGSTRQHEILVRESGFKTKQEAVNAEAARRVEEQTKYDMAKACVTVTTAVPTTLETLLQEFFVQHAEQNLAPATIFGYRKDAAHLDPDLLAMPLDELTPLHFNREWSRLQKCGGHTRKKTPRPMSGKTIRNIAGMVSSAFTRAIKWGIVATNPVTNSEPPRVKKHLAIALAPAQQNLLLESASGPWCLRAILEIAAATGCRRGEILALRWCDLVDGYLIIARSLCQTAGRAAIQGHQDGEAQAGLAAGVRHCRARGAPPEAGSLPRKVRDALPHRPRPNLRQPGRNAAAARFYLLDGVRTLQAPWHPQAEGFRAPPPSTFPYVDPADRRRASGGGLRAPRA